MFIVLTERGSAWFLGRLFTKVRIPLQCMHMDAVPVIRILDLENILLERSPQRAIQRAIDLIASSISSCSVTIMDVTPDKQVRFAAANGIPWSLLRRVEREFNRQMPQNLRQVLTTHKMCFIEDVAAYADWRASAHTIASYVGYPVVLDRRVVSIINIQTSERRLTQDDVQALSPIVHLMSLIIERYLREREAAARQNILALLYETALDGVRAPTAGEFMNRAMAHISRRLKYHAIGVFLYDDERRVLVLTAQRGYDASVNGLSFPVDSRVSVVVRAFQRCKPVVVRDARMSRFYYRALPGGLSEVAVPLLAGDRVIGVLSLESRRLRRYSHEDVRNLAPLASSIALSLENMQMNEHLRLQARLDNLTGAYNRHVMQEMVRSEMNRAGRHGRDLSFVMLDIDALKAVNDTLGHQEGDRVLRGLVLCLRSSLRPSDHVIRYGGDEFLLLLPETTVVEAKILMERMRTTIVERVRTSLGPVLFSAGIASVGADAGVADLVHLADERLLQAKSSGGNDVVTE
jgi:diguanylate cyclase (GGDEF)-like protein